MTEVENTKPKQRHGFQPGNSFGFQKGQSGNPAGKPKGALNRNTREIIQRALGDGLTPLETMLTSMREAWERGDVENAFKYAVAAAPYCHPRLQAVAHSGVDDDKITVVIRKFCLPEEYKDDPLPPDDDDENVQQ